MTKSAIAALLAAALGACSGAAGGNQGNAAAQADSNVQAGPAPAAAPGPMLGPLTAAEICERLNAAAVGEIIGQVSTRAAPSDSSTPQCTYSYPHGPGDLTITVAYMRPDGDLGGNTGAAGFDYVVRLNRSMAAGAREQAVQAGQRALRLSGSNLHMGVVLTGGRVMTVVALPSMPEAQVDRIIQAAGEAFGR